jgi:hypothetical protein
MWNKIEKEAYMQKVVGLKPLESYTDPEGTLPFSCGIPQIETIWGTEGGKEEYDKTVVKCKMTKQNRHQQDWDTEYFEYQ